MKNNKWRGYCEMTILNETVTIKWNYRFREYYTEKGYVFTGFGDAFEVKVDDLQKGSNVLIKFKCDYCLGDKQTEEKDWFKRYEKIISARKDGKDVCAHRDCINTLFDSNSPLIKDWHPTLNGKLTPEHVSFASARKVWWLGKKCGHEWDTQVKSRTLLGSGCPYCNLSNGERAIYDVLRMLKINFKIEHTIPKLYGVSGGLLRFDFAIFDDDDKFDFLLEYDGEQHFRDVFNDGSYEIAIEHDKIKNDYCKKNKTPLVRIPYWEKENIPRLVVNALKSQSIF
jgi:hypothetical protein